MTQSQRFTVRSMNYPEYVVSAPQMKGRNHRVDISNPEQIKSKQSALHGYIPLEVGLSDKLFFHNLGKLTL